MQSTASQAETSVATHDFKNQSRKVTNSQKATTTINKPRPGDKEYYGFQSCYNMYVLGHFSVDSLRPYGL